MRQAPPAIGPTSSSLASTSDHAMTPAPTSKAIQPILSGALARCASTRTGRTSVSGAAGGVFAAASSLRVNGSDEGHGEDNRLACEGLPAALRFKIRRGGFLSWCWSCCWRD